MKSHVCSGASFLALCSFSCMASAGDIILKTELWDFICEVEVIVGPEVPGVFDGVLEFPGVQVGLEYVDGVVFTGEGRLCYRRSSVADDCYSDMNDWVCYTNYSDEPEIILIY